MSAVIVGGGATGLCLAYLLARDGVPVTVVEAGPVAGGLLAAFEPVPGVRLEHYYHHFFTHDVEIEWLMRELGISDEAAFKKTTMGVYRDGEIFPFDGAADLLRFKPIGLVDRVRFGASSLLMTRWGALAEREATPALEWFNRYAGRRATDSIWRPLMTSKFGDAAATVPLAWMAGRLRQRARSRRGAVERLGYVRGSMQTVVDALVGALTKLGVRIMLDTPAESILIENGRAVGVRTKTGDVRADRVVSTVPTDVLAALVERDRPDYAASLRRVEYLGAVATVLVMDKPLSPVYWLNVADAGFDFGGVIEQTHLVPASEYAGRHITYLSKYAAWDDPIWKLNHEQLLERQLAQVDRLFKTNVRAQLERSYIFRARHAAPLIGLNFYERIPAMRSPIDGMFVASMAHVYPDERSVNNSIRVAAAAKAAMGYGGVMPPAGNSLAAKYGAK
jgi:protoporphyrinogen oxidase